MSLTAGLTSSSPLVSLRRSLSNHSSKDTTSNRKPQFFSVCSKDDQVNSRELHKLKTESSTYSPTAELDARASPNTLGVAHVLATSRILDASLSTGSQEHVCDSSGSAPSVSADRIINGRASVSFQRPFFEWPETWPIRRE